MLHPILAQVMVGSLVAAGAVVGLAPPSSAASQVVSVPCADFNGDTAAFPVTDITAAPGDTVEITFDPATCTAPRPHAVVWPGDAWSLYFTERPFYVDTPAVLTIRTDAPLGVMPYADAGLPYACLSCNPGASLRFTIARARDLTVSHQAIGRHGSGAACPQGWGPSWQEWAIASTGGWVCVQDSYAYYPGQAVTR